MSRRGRSWWIRIPVILVVLGVAGYWIAWQTLQSPWMAEQIRVRVLSEIEKATGGRAELQRFSMDWTGWRANIEGLVLHGTEPAGAEPLLRVPKAAVDLKVLSFLEKKVNVSAVRLDGPEVHLMRDAQGAWNLPQPPAARRSGKSPVETVLDLAIGELAVRGALVHYEDRIVPVDLTARDVEAKLQYDRGARAYAGNIAMRQSTLAAPLAVPVNFELHGPVRFDAAGLEMAGAELALGKSAAKVNVTLRDWNTPAVTVEGDGTVLVADLHKPLRLPIEPGGEIRVQGRLTAGAGQPWAAQGTASANGLAYSARGIRIGGASATASWKAESNLVAVDNLKASALGGSFTGRARLENGARFHVEGTASGLELERLYALQYQTIKSDIPLVWAGVVRGPVVMDGTVSAFQVAVDLTIDPPETGDTTRQPVSGALKATYESSRGEVSVDAAHLDLPQTKLNIQGDPNRQLKFSLLSSDLNDLLPALRMFSADPPTSLPVALDRGQLHTEGTWNGSIDHGRVTGQLSAGPALVEGIRIESFETDYTLEPQLLTLRATRLRASEASVEGDGSIALVAWRPQPASRVSGNLRVSAARIQPLLALAGSGSIPITGSLQASLRIEGTYASPAVAGNFTATGATVWQEQIQSIKAEFRAARNEVEVSSASIAAGPGRATGSGSATAPNGDWRSATAQFKISGQDFTLEQWKYLKTIRKGYRGDLDADVNGAIRFTNGVARVSSIEGHILVPNLQVENMPLGEVGADISTKDQLVTLKASATLGGAHINGTTEWSLGPSTFGLGQFTFRNVTLTTFQDLGIIDPATQLPARGVFEGELGFSGPILDPLSWTANAKITRAELRPFLRDSITDPKRVAEANRFALRNDGPLMAFIDKNGVRLTTAHMIGEGTDIQVDGTIGVSGRSPLNLNILGKMNLPALSMVEPDLIASGQAQVDVQVRGEFERPQMLGSMGLQNASFYLDGLPNGLDKVNGTVRFDRTRATIEKFTAVTGGGELTLGGFVGFNTSQLIYRLNAHASRVRLRYPEAVSTTFDGDLSLTGTSAQSLLSGTITINRLGLNPKTDLGSILAEAARATPVDPIQNRSLRGMQLDIKIGTSPDAELQTSLTRDIQPEADLKLRGTAARPALLGRVSVNEGEIQFFGNQYLITRGEVGFFNPTKIEPFVNLDLETKARGITVTINLSGPPNKLNISYRSDPPLQSNEIVALLTVGRAPASSTSFNSPNTQSAGLLQSGGNSLLGAAISAPLTGPINDRLQRFFGVSRIKIDPELNTITNTPQARLTIEQQLSREITVTYITNLNRTQNQIVRMQWDFSRDFSVLAVRDENGIFGIDFQYRKRFK
ncbi:MAG: translocation/assembly module TamB domain-containing protein [Acidobacteriota bacterium]